MLTKKEFADRCGIKTKDLSNYIKRGNVVATGEFIDETFGKNVDFLRLMENKGQKKQDREAIERPAAKVKVAKKAANKVAPKKKGPVKKERRAPAPKVSKEAINKYRLELERERLELDRLEQNNRYLKIKADKAEGLVIPTELVMILFLKHSRSITLAFRNVIESELEIMSVRFGMNAAERAAMRKRLIDELNKAISNAIDSSKGEVAGIVDEYSETRGVGEKV